MAKLLTFEEMDLLSLADQKKYISDLCDKLRASEISENTVRQYDEHYHENKHKNSKSHHCCVTKIASMRI